MLGAYANVDRACDPDILQPSLNDECAEMIMRRTCVYDNGHYRIGILWKEECLNLPNNYQMAMSRLNSLGRLLMANSEIRSKNTEKIRDMIAQGHAY